MVASAIFYKLFTYGVGVCSDLGSLMEEKYLIQDLSYMGKSQVVPQD